MAKESLGTVTLLKFDGPFLVRKEEKKTLKDDPYHFCKSTNVAMFNWNPDPNAIALCQDSDSTQKEIEEVLNAIHPPIFWEEEGKSYKQIVSTAVGMRADVIYLHKELDHRLLVRQAREDGICMIRRELYAQAFDEVIRQVTTTCPERGLLLLRVRDEMRMTIKSYQALNDASSAFGIKVPRNDLNQRRQQKRYERLSRDKKRLEAERADLKEELQLVRRTFEEQKFADDKRHYEQVQFLKRVNQLLRQKFESIVKIKLEDVEE